MRERAENMSFYLLWKFNTLIERAKVTAKTVANVGTIKATATKKPFLKAK